MADMHNGRSLWSPAAFAESGWPSAPRLAARGVTVAAGYSKDKETAQRFLDTYGPEKASIHQGNIGSNEDCERVVQEVLDRHGRLDILVNNAGITMDSTVRKMTPAAWNRVVEVNLSGAFYLSRAILQHMLDRGSGRIIMISSVIGSSGNIGQANYAAAKSGVFGLTMSLAQETARKGITVNSVTPGFISTEMTAAVPAGGDGEGRRQDPGGSSRRTRRGGPGRGVLGRPRLGIHHRPGLCRQRRALHVNRCFSPVRLGVSVSVRSTRWRCRPRGRWRHERFGPAGLG